MASIGAALGGSTGIPWSQPFSRHAPSGAAHSNWLAIPARLSAPLLPAKNPSRSSALRRHQVHLRQCVAARASAASKNAIGVATSLQESLIKSNLLQRVLKITFVPPGSGGGALFWLVIAAPAVLWYFAAAAPGCVWGLVDYAYAPLHSLSNISFDANEVQVGRQIGQGSYGVVYEGFIGRGVRKLSKRKELHVILKKVKPQTRDASEMHNSEVHMNRRVQRSAPYSCADFLGTTIVKHSETMGRLSEGTWLVWRYEGDKTLKYYMQQKTFPQNIADILFGSSMVRDTSKVDSLEQSNAIIRKVTVHILSSLRDLHKTGVVHRDVKPSNLVFAKDSCTIKLIDLGAAVDLRSGFNYVPDETIMDPAYSAPERHVMPVSTPKLPPDPLCSLVSPLLWLLNTPDRFDVFSAGVVLLQMAVRPLRQDIGLMTFNSEFRRVGYNLDLWRKRCHFSKEEFALLDANSGAGWELLRCLLQPRHDKDFIIWPSLGWSRPSAKAALRHRYLTGSSSSSKGLQLPSIILSSQTRNLVSNFDFDSFRAKIHLLPQKVMSKFTFAASLPEFSLKSLHRSSLNSISCKILNFSSLLPVFGKASSSNSLVSVGYWFAVDWREGIKILGFVPPLAASSALTLTITWLVLWLLKEFAQSSYATGEESMKVVGISGVVGLSIVVVSRLLTSLASSTRDFAASNSPHVLSEAPVWRVDAGEQPTKKNVVDRRSTGADNTSTSSVQSSGKLLLAQETAFNVESARAEAGVNKATKRELGVSNVPEGKKQQSPAREGSSAIRGLAEVVQTMEMQLAALESLISSDGVSSKKREEQIDQMEKLLKQGRSVSVFPHTKFRS